MKAIAVISLMLTVASYIPGLGLGQTPDLFTRVESSIREKEPEWKIVHKLVSKNGKSVSYEWKSGERSVGVLIFVYDSKEQANRTFKGLRYDFEAHGLKMAILPTTVPNLGDENYLWEDDNNKEITGIDFRKGKVFVHVSTRSMDIAKRFALKIADEIPGDF